MRVELQVVLNLYHFPDGCSHTLIFHSMETIPSLGVPLSRRIVSPLALGPPAIFVQNGCQQAEMAGNV